MSKAPVTLEFLARQQEQILAELAKMRVDHAELLAILQRIDAATHGKHAPPFDVFDPGSDP
jgi:hypothetical protein